MINFQYTGGQIDRDNILIDIHHRSQDGYRTSADGKEIRERY